MKKKKGNGAVGGNGGISVPTTALSHNARGKFIAGNGYAWKPGQSGNPSGRPRRDVLTKHLLKLATENGGERAKEAALKMWELAFGAFRLEGEAVVAIPAQAAYMKELFDRVEGKVAMEIKGSLGVAAVDLTKLEDNDLEQMEAMLLRASSNGDDAN